MCALFPTFPRLQLSLLIIPGTVVANKLIALGPPGSRGQFGHSYSVLGESRLMDVGTRSFIPLGLQTERQPGSVLFGHTDTAHVAIPPPSLPSPALLC